jgi:hypothetical protein
MVGGANGVADRVPLDVSFWDAATANTPFSELWEPRSAVASRPRPKASRCKY